VITADDEAADQKGGALQFTRQAFAKRINK